MNESQLPPLSPVKPLGPVGLVLEAAEVASRLGNQVLQTGTREPKALADARAKLSLSLDLVGAVEAFQAREAEARLLVVNA